jgi:hypothetical protein
VVKATYELDRKGPRLAEEQAPVNAEGDGFADRLRYLAAQGDTHAAQEAEKVRQRCLATLEALAWNASEVVPLTWDWWERARPSPEDHFAPALVLRRLEPDTPRLRERWELLSPELRALVDAVLSAPTALS